MSVGQTRGEDRVEGAEELHQRHQRRDADDDAGHDDGSAEHGVEGRSRRRPHARQAERGRRADDRREHGARGGDDDRLFASASTRNGLESALPYHCTEKPVISLAWRPALKENSTTRRIGR